MWARKNVLLLRAFLPAGLLLASAHATAAPSAAPDPVVVELYKTGRELVNAGRWDEGCPKFDRAMEKQPTAAILINVGDCREHAGKLAGALEAFEIAQTLNKETHDPVRRNALVTEIEQRIAKLTPRVPTLRIVIENPAPQMVVHKNSDVVPEDLLGTDMPVDPGTYEVSAEAPSQTAPGVRITLKEGGSERVTLRLVPRSFIAEHKLSVATLGFAVLAAGAGGAFAAWTTETHGSLSDVCKSGAEKPCLDAKSSIETGSLATNIAFGVAGAAAITAALVFTLGERPKSPQIKVMLSGPGAQIRVNW